MDTRTADLAALRKAKAELKKLQSLEKEIEAAEYTIKNTRTDHVDPGYYETVPTDEAKLVGERCFEEASKKATGNAKVVATIGTIIILCIFAYSIYLLWNAPESAWIKVMDQPDSIIDECTVYWVAHCLAGLLLLVAPWLFV